MSLQAGQDIHIIACPRGELTGPDLGSTTVTVGTVAARRTAARWRAPGRPRIVLRRVVHGVRWAARPDLGFPLKGFRVSRVRGATQTKIGDFFLPRSKNWAQFRADAEARRPARGPYFPTITRPNLGYLLPIVRLADPRTPAQELRSLTVKVADFFGHPHAEDPELAWSFWGPLPAPSLAALLTGTATRAALISFYRARATAYLLALALRFEYAVLFGLATDDVTAAASAAVNYTVMARWGADTGSSSTALDRKKECTPPPPKAATADRVPGSVAHPAFSAWPSWVPPPPLSPTDADGEPLPPGALVPRAPSPHTALSWTEAATSGRLIDYGPVLYAVSRFHFGADSAAQLASPPLPAGAVFEPLFDGEPLIRPTAPPHTIDRPGMPWPPLEGHYVYEVRGVNLLGFVSAAGARAKIRHHDDLPPHAPRVRSLSGASVGVDGAGKVVAELAIDWDAAEDLVSPDVVEFRVAASFAPLSAVAVEVNELLAADPLICNIRVGAIAGPPDRYAGLRLMLPNGEFVIVEHGAGTPATMRVRRSGGRVPVTGVTGTILEAQPPTPDVRVAAVARSAAVAAVVDEVASIAPVEIRLAPYVPINAARLYLHLLRVTVDAERVGDRFRLTPPAEGSPGAEAWGKWLARPDASALMKGAPVIVFPPHQLTVEVDAPAGFVAGALSLKVTSADDADYVASPALPAASPPLPNLTGNESSFAELLLSVRSPASPQPPDVGAFDPTSRLWASSAASYAESARFELKWAAAPGAIRYEVWRALEGNVSGAGPQTTDAELRALAGTQPSAFVLRSGAAFGTRFTDELPGRAPTRALYHVRAISAAGVASEFSPLVGPVHVPDVRRPPPPNLVRVAAVPPAEAPRALAVEWTQPALTPDVRFDIERREADAGDARFALVASLPRGTVPVAGRFRFVHAGQIPGQRVEYRVTAVREALDPIDAGAAARRDIRSQPSQPRIGVAIAAGPLAPPIAFAATHDAATGSVRLSWTNDDSYLRIAVYRRAPARFGLELVAQLSGTAELHDDATVSAGTWAYQLRARGVSREARSETLEVVVP